MNDGPVTDSYSTGSVIGNAPIGGLVGQNDTSILASVVTGSYWDMETSGQSQSVSDRGTGETTAEMRMQSTYVGWDFNNIWAIKEGATYPYLRWETPPTPPDTTAPVLAVPGTVVAEAAGPSGALVPYTVTATDDVDGSVTPTCAPVSGALFAIGSTVVTCTASDAHGNATTASFTVRVRDTTAPVITVSGPDGVPVGKGNSRMASVFTVTAVDTCSGTVPARITTVEVFNNGGNPVTGAGVYQVSGNTVTVTPNGNGWSVRITATATDGYGNSATVATTRILR